MNKTALVTGASNGLGFCLCKELLNRKYNVVALDYKISEELMALESKKLQIIQCDLSSDSDVINAKMECKVSKFDIIINNAGIWLDRERKMLDDDSFEFNSIIKQYQVNAVGVLRIAKAFIPLLLDGNGKVMINISSEASSIQDCYRKCEYGYCMSKAAQNMATKILSNTYSEKGIKFYAIHPGWMITEQGCAGATTTQQPQQKPTDSAKFIIDLAEQRNKSKIFYDINGTEMNW